ncbi:hypothetical protein ACTFIY_000793 [Dictyostelium cf. discoideum]
MYPFAKTNTRFFKNTTNGKSGIKLGANEAIYDNNEQIYSTSGNVIVNDPLIFNGITVDSTGIHLPTSTNVYIGTKPLDNSTQIDTHGEIFSPNGIHLTNDQNIYDVDGVPLNNTPLPLDTHGVTFSSDGVHLGSSSQKFYDSNGTALGGSSPTLDTKGITFTDSGIVLGNSNQKSDGTVIDNLDTKGISFTNGGIVIGNPNQKFKKFDGTVIDNFDTKGIAFTNDGVDIPESRMIKIGNTVISSNGLLNTYPNSTFMLGSLLISNDRVTLGYNQILYDRFGNEIKTIDTNGIQVTAGGIVLNQGMKIYNQDMTLYSPITTPPTEFLFEIGYTIKEPGWQNLTTPFFQNVKAIVHGDGRVDIHFPPTTVAYRPYGQTTVLNLNCYSTPNPLSWIKHQISVNFEYTNAGRENVGMLVFYPVSGGAIPRPHMLGLDRQDQKYYPCIIPLSSAIAVGTIINLTIQPFSFSFRR